MKKILSLILSLVFVLSLVGCGGDSPKAALKERLDATVSQAQASVESETDQNSQIIMRTVAQNMKYKIGEQKVNGNSATVKVTITTIDLSALMAKAAEVYTSQSETNPDFSIDEWLAAEIVKDGVATVTNEAEVVMIKTEEDGWIIDESAQNESLANALTGGYFGAVNGVIENR